MTAVEYRLTASAAEFWAVTVSRLWTSAAVMVASAETLTGFQDWKSVPFSVIPAAGLRKSPFPEKPSTQPGLWLLMSS